jgi:hypothetical protein
MSQLIPLSAPASPALIEAPGDCARVGFIKFLTANIRNRNTRRAYPHLTPPLAAARRGSRLHQLSPIRISGCPGVARRNDMAKLMTTYRAIERGSWKVKAEGKHGGAIGRSALRVLETFLFVLYRPGKALCLPYEAIAEAALLSRRTVADAIQHLATFRRKNREPIRLD